MPLQQVVRDCIGNCSGVGYSGNHFTWAELADYVDNDGSGDFTGHCTIFDAADYYDYVTEIYTGSAAAGDCSFSATGVASLPVSIILPHNLLQCRVMVRSVLSFGDATLGFHACLAHIVCIH